MCASVKPTLKLNGTLFASTVNNLPLFSAIIDHGTKSWFNGIGSTAAVQIGNRNRELIMTKKIFPMPRVGDLKREGKQRERQEQRSVLQARSAKDLEAKMVASRAAELEEQAQRRAKRVLSPRVRPPQPPVVLPTRTNEIHFVIEVPRHSWEQSAGIVEIAASVLQRRLSLPIQVFAVPCQTMSDCDPGEELLRIVDSGKEHLAANPKAAMHVCLEWISLRMPEHYEIPFQRMTFTDRDGLVRHHWACPRNDGWALKHLPKPPPSVPRSKIQRTNAQIRSGDKIIAALKEVWGRVSKFQHMPNQ